MKVTLNDAFEPFFSDKKFDKSLSEKIYQFHINYINSDKQYIEFYGSNLLGVHVVRFKDKDVNAFFNRDVLDIDYLGLSEALKKVTDINQDFKISSDVLNLTLFYLLHRFATSKVINDQTRHRAMYDVALIFFYRTTAALISNIFKYPADPAIAQKAYSNLSQKYLIKQLGSWSKVMDYRANKLIDKHEIHYKSIMEFTNDINIVYAINDSQGRIRDLIKNYYGEFSRVHQGGERIQSKGSTYFDIEGEETVKEKINTIEAKIAYIKDVIQDEHSFIKDDLLTIISRTNSNVSFRSLKTCLKWIHTEYNASKHHALIEEFINVAMVHSFYLIQYSICPKTLKDYPAILTGLKNLLASSRSVDKDLLKIRELGEKIITLCFPYKISDSLMIAIRSSLVLYLVLRTLINIK